jgi:hypothetical protein
MSSHTYNLRNRDLNVTQRTRTLKRAVVKQQKSPKTPAIKRKVYRSPKADPRFNFDQNYLKHPDAVSIFAPEIFAFMKHQEATYQLPDYLKSNRVITERHRALVVDWLVECQEAHGFVHETLYIAIRLFDIHLAKHPSTPVKKLQLVAASGFLIASKYEEYEAIRIKSLKSLCMDMYEESEFMAMEREVLRSAQCDLGFPLAYSFLRRYARVVGTDMKTITLARMYLELSIHYFKWALESPSKIAASVLILAITEIDHQIGWEAILEHYSEFSMEDLQATVKQLKSSITRFKTMFPKCTAVVSKYSDVAFFDVANEFLT